LKALRVIFVEMFTDEGITGFGVQEGHSQVCIPLIRDLIAPYLVENQVNPFDTELISSFLRRLQPRAGQASAVEVAAWDIVGKACGQPISKLLGGFRDRIKAYASTGEHRSPERRVEDVFDYMERGFKALKLKARHENPMEIVDIVEAIRKAVGDQIDIMVDCVYARGNELSSPQPWTLSTALKVGRRLEELNVLWLEEPMVRTDKEGLATLCRELDMAIAGGESEYGIYTYKELLEGRVYDIIQCDVTLSGGFSETKKIAALAQSHNRWCIPHGWSVGIGLIANLHLACSVPNCPYFEYTLEPPAFEIDMRDMVMTEPLLAIDGYVSLPTGPGLGVELNREVITKYTVVAP
jgi:L-alanine-DL-glutamate epimerase-like enolase superfamily enzyme